MHDEAMTARFARLPGGRLDFAEGGSPDAPVVVVLDGLGSRLVGTLAARAAATAGTPARVLAPDRPGYWGSAPRDGDPLTSWPGACAELLDHLDVERAAIVASSAACPHAFATAAELPQRIASVSIVGPMAPFTVVPEPDDMEPAQLRSFRLAARSPTVGAASTRAMGLLARISPRTALRIVASQRPRIDADRMAEPELRDLMLESLPGLLGPPAAADLTTLVSDWRTMVTDVTQPVRVWVGSRDTVHPPSMAAGLCTLVPAAEVTTVDGGFFACTDRLDEVLGWSVATI